MPYDAFFNRFFAGLAEALRATGGYYSTFDGDGPMALHETTADVRRECRDATRGAIAIVERLATMNAAPGTDPGEPPQGGIGIAAGGAFVGRMGPPATPLLSALGRGEPVTCYAIRGPHLLACELAQ